MQGAEQPRRLIPLLFLSLAALAFGTAASVPTSQPTGSAGAFLIGTTGARWQTDPGVAYISNACELEYATCAKLVNYPDRTVGPTPSRSATTTNRRRGFPVGLLVGRR